MYLLQTNSDNIVFEFNVFEFTLATMQTQSEDVCATSQINKEIVCIIDRYLETGSEDEACSYLTKAKGDQEKAIFIANCIELYITKWITDNVKNQQDLQDIEGLF
eukprot:1135448_1